MALVSGYTAPIVASTALATKILSGVVQILKSPGYCECRKSLMMEIKIDKKRQLEQRPGPSPWPFLAGLDVPGDV